MLIDVSYKKLFEKVEYDEISKKFKKTKLLDNKSEVLVFIRNTFSTFLRKEITLDF